jgi:EAL domain-containing protein (putative c-di-GMP-specific phosphodiesterase class I)
MSDAEHATRVLRDLRATGVAVSLDDFGTGYSSLGRLVALPITGLKIDQLFVRGLETEVGREMIILAIIALGHQLGLEITAEGVETEPQSAYLRSAGCDRLQGYHLGRPMPAAEMERRLAA